MTKNKVWNVVELLNTTAHYFKEKNIENPRLNAEYLLGKILNLKRVELYVAFERPVTNTELTAFRGFVKRRSMSEPLQYILGETEFMGLTFKVNPGVFIPRPETEILVEEVLKLKPFYKDKQPVVIDIGSGSGSISVSLADSWPEARFACTDISYAALETAKDNAFLNQLEAVIFRKNHSPAENPALQNGRLTFVEHDIFSEWHPLLPKQADILISNPPYIALDEMPALPLEVKDYEPHIALTDQADGLNFYKRIFELVCKEQTLNCQYIFFEMSGSQPQRIIELANEHSFPEIEIINDLNEIPRVLKIKAQK